MSTAALQQAIDLAGSQTELARMIKKRQSNIASWLHRDKKVPAEAVIPIAEALNYEVTPHQLRPDVYPDPQDGMRGRAA
jgi:DNA-binding transcriptional regulator YdaS (Cro superfamily)